MRNRIFKKNGEGGFTIVELIMVIVVLGVLATFALPRFPNWNSQARVSAVQGLEGSLHASAALANATQLAAGLSGGASVSMDGQTVEMQHSFPTKAASGIAVSLQTYRGFDFTVVGGHAIFSHQSAGSPGACYAAYAQATGTGMAATISSDTSGC